jgi:tRNA G18 (ribose-2'-O)-methylase SpoU
MPTPQRLAKIEGYRGQLLPFAIAVVNMSKEMNIGSILRTAHACAAQELILIGEPSFNTYAAASTEKWTDVCYLETPAELVAYAREQGMEIVALESETNAVSMFEATYPRRPLFVLGQEKGGVPPEIMEAAALVVEIPQWGLVPSLNVAAAGSVVIYDHIAKLCGARRPCQSPHDLATLRAIAEEAPPNA